MYNLFIYSNNILLPLPPADSCFFFLDWVRSRVIQFASLTKSSKGMNPSGGEYEAYVPTQQTQTRQMPWFPCSHGHPWRQERVEGPSCKRTQEAHSLEAVSCSCIVPEPMKGTIKSKEDIERLFKNGRRSSSSFMTILFLESEGDGKGRCAFIAGKKLGNAPFRSRCKRVLRSIAHELGGPWKGFDVVFIAKHKVAHADHMKVLKDTEKRLIESGVVDGDAEGGMGHHQRS